jgi:uncharacterized protein (TIGR02145 family)
MTTNLTAWKYEISTPTLSADADAGSSYTDLRWCYPKVAGTVSANEPVPSTWNSRQGLLYNWPAATGNQNTATNNQGQVAGATPGTDEVENQAPNGHYQGICPTGWHVPSDREWNELEKVIYANPQLYSDYTDKTGWSYPNWVSTWETSPSYRPSSSFPDAHGKAMKEICGLTGTVSGRSKSLAAGGFGALLAGYALGGSTDNFGNNAVFWSSSSSNSNYSWSRLLSVGNAGVSRNSYGRNGLFSVRCKKD